MALKVTPVLGVVKVLSGGALGEGYRTANNNTRWIFEVEGTPEGESDLVVQLIDLYGREYNPDLGESFFSPKTASFYDAKPFEQERVGGRITVRHGGVYPAPSGDGMKSHHCKYRVMIDTMHSASR